MKFKKIASGEYPLTLAQVIDSLPNTSFPGDVSGVDWQSFGFALVTPQQPPVYDAETHELTVGEVVPGEAGLEQTWQVVPLPTKVADEKFKARKLQEKVKIDQQRDAMRWVNVTAHNRLWQADQNSKALLLDAITLALAGLPLPKEWRDADNSNMAITSLDDLLTIAKAMADQTHDAYTWSWEKKAAIEQTPRQKG